MMMALDRFCSHSTSSTFVAATSCLEFEACPKVHMRGKQLCNGSIKIRTLIYKLSLGVAPLPAAAMYTFSDHQAEGKLPSIDVERGRQVPDLTDTILIINDSKQVT